MIVVPFKEEHLLNFEIQKGQHEMVPFLELEGYAEELSKYGNGYTLIEDGVVLACAGLAEQSKFKAVAWVLISKNLKPRHMIFLTNRVREHLNSSTYIRIEAIIRKGFDEAFRWINILGFKCETQEGMENWFVTGESAYLFSRIK